MIAYAIPARPQVFSARFWGVLGRELSRSLRFRLPKRVCLRWVDAVEMRRLNKAYRGKDRPTDVLSFEATGNLREDAGYLGDLVICPSYAADEARRRSIPLKEEILRLVIHGTMHLAGYDHATLDEEARMFGVQERTLSRILEVCPLRS